ncbi:MAG: hypothetical protein AB8G11_26115 [Saprospiraceae bacterium]
MKILQKTIFLILFTFGFIYSINAQNADYRNNFYVGGGFSAYGILNSITSLQQDSIAPDNITWRSNGRSKPAIQLTYDFALSNKFSVGVAYSYQRFILDVPQYIYSDSKRNNIAIRFLWHYVQNERLDMYTAARIGMTFWNESFDYDYDPLDTVEKRRLLAPQVALGTRYYITQNIGLGIEAALGAPHYFSFGVNYRL